MTVHLFFEDGPIQEGFWTGQEWVVNGRPVQPVSWQPLYIEVTTD